MLENKDPKYLEYITKAPRAIPGQSLTADPENPRPFEGPPRFVSIHEASEHIFMNMLDEDNYVDLMQELINGRSVMETAQVLLFAGFYKGMWNPDLMMLLAEPVAYMILALAERAGIEAKIYEGEEYDEDLEEEDGMQSPVPVPSEAQLKALQKRNKKFRDLPNNVKINADLQEKINDLPKKEEIESLIQRPEKNEPPEESLLAPNTEEM